MSRKKAKQVQKGPEPEQGARTPASAALPPVLLAELVSGGRWPAGAAARPLREALLLRSQQRFGNRVVQRRVIPGTRGGPAPAALQRDDEEGEEVEVEEEAPVTHPGGRGPGRVTGATETYYRVTGATLDEVSPQLAHYDGFGAQTTSDIGMNGRVRPEEQEDGTLRAEIDWVVTNETVGLPRWMDYDQACPAAQQEWDRFMGQTRIHEQTAHVDAGNTFVEELGPEDTVITGADRAEFRENLVAKRDDLGQRLQAIHDGCDHGVAIDAILHPDNGRCAEPGADDEGEFTESTILEIE